MDISLLNYYIKELHFNIENSYLILELEPFEEGTVNKYQIKLTCNKDKILDFFGLDNTVEYDKLNERNLWIYLTSSPKLSERHMSFTGFKGPHPKNKYHARFNEYLVGTYENIDKYNKKELDTLRESWLRRATLYFKIEKEISDWKHEKSIMNKIMQWYRAINDKEIESYDIFQRFIKYWGVRTINMWTETQFFIEFAMFKDKNWSNLDSI